MMYYNFSHMIYITSISRKMNIKPLSWNNILRLGIKLYITVQIILILVSIK